MRRSHAEMSRRGFLFATSATALAACSPKAEAAPPSWSFGYGPNPPANMETAVLAGGCFWGVQAVFAHVKGVKESISGYSGGHQVNPTYEQVSTGLTGHAESVRVVFDPRQITYQEILDIFFAVATDPTEVNRQGPDVGTQYRNEIFTTKTTQRDTARATIARLNAAHVYRRPIATKVSALQTFYPAEEYHQDFLFRNPNHSYIVINDKPKIEALRAMFPTKYAATPVRLALR